MLVYANHLVLVGANPGLHVLRAVAGWLGEKLDQRLAVRDVTHLGELSGGTPRAYARGDWAQGQGFTLYAWVLKHPDSTISGRQWITEIGLRDNDDGSAEFSCVVQTEEQSTLISEAVHASRPRVVRFLVDNVRAASGVDFATDTVGTRVRWVGADLDSYRALLAEIEATNRTHPLVIVSPDNSGHYEWDPLRLQKTLFGLAQVVGVASGYNSYDMEEVLGRTYSAWAGALNVLRPARHDGRIYSDLMFPRDLPPECDNAYKKEGVVLGRVTHMTNIPMLRDRIRPEGVRNLAARQRLLKRLEQFSATNDSEQAEELHLVSEELESLTRQNEELRRNLDQRDMTIMEHEDTIDSLQKQINTQSYRQQEQWSRAGGAPEPAGGVLADWIEQTVSAQAPTPVDCLALLAKTYPQQLVVLPSAYDSAAEVAQFQQSRRLLDMLNRLVVNYLPTYLQGGDSRARNVFTPNEYAAGESDTVMNNKDYRRQRQFEYQGEPVEMLKHLKVGKADDPTQTVRVHFEIDQDAHRVVIGHCGLHLPLRHH